MKRLNDSLSAKQFRIRPDTTSSRWIPVRIEDAMLCDVEYRDRIFQVQVTFDLIDPGAMTAIYLDVPGFSQQMISDFPRCLLRRDSATCELQLSYFELPFEEMLSMPLFPATPSLPTPTLSRDNSSKSASQVSPTPKPQDPLLERMWSKASRDRK
jgi:hypothetical protein